jgi:hypothetical protein
MSACSPPDGGSSMRKVPRENQISFIEVCEPRYGARAIEMQSVRRICRKRYQGRRWATTAEAGARGFIYESRAGPKVATINSSWTDGLSGVEMVAWAVWPAEGPAPVTSATRIPTVPGCRTRPNNGIFPKSGHDAQTFSTANPLRACPFYGAAQLICYLEFDEPVQSDRHKKRMALLHLMRASHEPYAMC